MDSFNFLEDFKVQTSPLVPVKSQDLGIINKSKKFVLL